MIASASAAMTQTVAWTASIPSPPRGVWEIGPIPIRAYAVCIIAGILVAGFWGNRRLVARGGRPGATTDLMIWMIPFGIVGGRLYHVISDPELYFCGDGCNPWNAFAIWNGGLGIWGAIALGGLGAYIGARRYKIAFGAVADALAPTIVIAQAIGRLGNYFNQELFGGPTSMPWGLDVFLRTPGGVPNAAVTCSAYQGEFPADWIKTDPAVLCGTYHPTFLYELLWSVGVAILVVWADRHFRLGHGRAFALYVAGYTAGRGWIEMMRIDHANHIFGLRLNVFVSIAVFLAAVIYLIATRRLGREDPASVRGIVPGERSAPPHSDDEEPGVDETVVAAGDGDSDATDATETVSATFAAGDAADAPDIGGDPGANEDVSPTQAPGAGTDRPLGTFAPRGDSAS